MKILVLMTAGTISQRAVEGKLQMVYSNQVILSRALVVDSLGL
jgi:hypothetical protein